MRPHILLAACALAAAALPGSAQTDAYKPGADSVRHDGVPQGELIQFDFSASKVFPGTTRHVTVYVPRQYNPATPACLYVDQDGVQWAGPVVLDNLIARGEVPVQVGVFVTPGVVAALDPKAALSRYNRSYEYDGLGDGYYRLITGEVLPEVERRRTGDGRPIRISASANDRAIAGSSSGAIAAFTAAWEHPESFSRVLSSIGTYVGLRGGDRYPALIRKTEPKPLRVFLQDGSSDLNIYGGDWWMANQTMERALVFAGYEVNHAWGDGGHTGKQITAILPDALRWLWKGWPAPVARGSSQNGALKALLAAGEEWTLVGDGYSAVQALASNSAGEVSFVDASTGAAYRVSPGAAPLPASGIPAHAAALRFGPDGALLAASDRQVLSLLNGKTTVLFDGPFPRDLAANRQGDIYLTARGAEGEVSDVWLLRGGRRQIVDTGLRRATGVTLSPDQSLLYVADADSHWIYSYQVRADGTLADKQRYFWLHAPDQDDSSGTGGLCCDAQGWLYAATSLGIQVCDQAGRVNAILPLPSGQPVAVCFGGAKRDTLYAACGGRVYARRLNASGADPSSAPVLPPVPRL